jgi:16S rRNA processing protein RimM
MDTLRLYGSDGTLRSELTLLSVRFLDSKGIVVAGTKEVKDRNGAEALVGTTVEILPEERYPLEEGAFWVDDLLGMTVVDHSTGDVLGTVSDVVPAGENDLYTVRDETGTDHFIPAVKEFIAGVDLEKREMRISLIEGLW